MPDLPRPPAPTRPTVAQSPQCTRASLPPPAGGCLTRGRLGAPGGAQPQGQPRSASETGRRPFATEHKRALDCLLVGGDPSKSPTATAAFFQGCGPCSGNSPWCLV